MEDGDGDPPQDDRHGEEDRGLSDCEGSVFVAIKSCKVLERQGKEGDGDDQEDVGEQLEGEGGGQYDLLLEVKLSVLPDVHCIENCLVHSHDSCEI